MEMHCDLLNVKKIESMLNMLNDDVIILYGVVLKLKINL